MRTLRLLACTAGMAVTATLVLAPAAHATFPARNGRIAFMADTGTGSQIYTVRPNGHDLRQISHVDGEAIKPDWSPDGRRIAFALNECSIAIMNADGGDMSVLPSQTPGGCEADPSFTPDGSRLVYERYDPSTEDDAVWSMNLDGSDRQRITSAGAPDPNVSPDGRMVSFLAGPENATALFTAGLDGSHLFQVTPSIGVSFKSDWAPDGRHLLISDNANNPERPGNLATVRPDGTGLRYLTDFQDPARRAYAGSYSPDGNWIVFRIEDHGRYGLYRMRPAGGPAHRILGLSSFKPVATDWGAAPDR
jgi:Tol biopolymer transport system component